MESGDGNADWDLRRDFLNIVNFYLLIWVVVA
jgi:hypothetical protein